MPKKVNNICPYCGQTISYRAFAEDGVEWTEYKMPFGSTLRQYFHKSCYLENKGRRKEANGKEKD